MCFGTIKGLENINLSRPEVGARYEVAALYFKAESTFNQPDADPRQSHISYVTVRLFVRGDLLGEFIDAPLTQVGQLWRVAEIEWCEDFNRCPVITPIDEILAEEEYNRP
ncbi:hypothetical protein KKB55_00350 [Myxococcota bacterium]|nr:hypothetical protein [Myxococcota bacterium]